MAKIKTNEIKTITIELNEMQLDAILFALTPAMKICDGSKKPKDLYFFPNNLEGYFFIALHSAVEKLIIASKQQLNNK